MIRRCRRLLLTILLMHSTLVSARFAVSADYDPLALPAADSPATADFTVKDEKRNREIPIRVYLPPSKEPAPVVLFSHGLGGTRSGSAYLGNHWAARGYVAVFLQHPGSDDSVWKNQPTSKRLEAMNTAASGQNYLLRVRDVTAVLDAISTWNTEADHALNGRLDTSRIGMSGHSFGAQTTQAVSGQSAGRLGQMFRDKRIAAAIIFSPNAPRRAEPAAAFGSVDIPWLLMTGTKDLSIIGDADMESRLAVFEHIAPGRKYELVLHNAEHSAFTDRALPGDKEPRNPNHHRAILALSTAFWDAYLRDGAEARAWLDGAGAKSVLEPQDRWQRK